MSERGEKYRHVSLKTPKDVILKCLVLSKDTCFTVIERQRNIWEIFIIYIVF